jgi:hypothetical protein
MEWNPERAEKPIFKALEAFQNALSFIDRLFDAATRADERLPRHVAPAGEGRGRETRLLFGFRFSFGEEASASFIRTGALILLRAAMFADPAKASIDEMSRLDHGRDERP